MNRAIGVFLGLILVVGVGTYVYHAKQEKLEPPERNPLTNPDIGNINPNAGGTSGGTQTNGYTLAQVAQHSGRLSCWSAINGSVYDLTSWIPNHPGGEEAILSLCGKDGSVAFTNQHGGQSRPAAILVGFKIGTLQ